MLAYAKCPRGCKTSKTRGFKSSKMSHLKKSFVHKRIQSKSMNHENVPDKNLPISEYVRRAPSNQSIFVKGGKTLEHFGLHCDANIQADMELNYVLEYCCKPDLPLNHILKDCTKNP